MEKLLNCSSIESSYTTIANILGVKVTEVTNFVLNNQYRFKMNNYGYLEYKERLTLNDMVNSFNITEEQIDFDYLVVQHVTSIYDEDSFLTNGIMGVKDLFSTENAFRSKLKEYGLNTGVGANEEPYIELRGTPVITDYLKHRFKRDRCINGFLTWNDAQIDDNVKDIRSCPEIISHISRNLLKNSYLETDWIQNAQPSIVSFIVNIDEIQGINNIPITKPNVLLSSLDSLLKFHVHYEDFQTTMIFLDENISLDASRIIEIRKINEYSKYSPMVNI